MKVRYSYLKEKFSDPEPMLTLMKEVIASGDFTLGKAVQEFETKFAELTGCKHAIGVANGTDAIKLPLKVLGIGPGDEVIVPANTFVASAGAVAELFAKPVFVDMSENYTIDPSKIEAAITSKTKAIVPVHFTGEPCDMDPIMNIAEKHNLHVVEDACQAVLAEYKGKMCGNFGIAGAVSLHPLKNLNVWGDGGVIMTNDDEMNRKLRLIRNHGLKNRDEIECFGVNSRLDAVQAAVGNYLISFTKESVEQRRKNAAYFDEHLKPWVWTPDRRDYAKSCFHLYMFEVRPDLRNPLVKFLNDAGIEAKVHYPIPLQGVLGLYGLGREEFPKAFAQADRIITLPVDEHMTKEMQDYCITKVGEFFEQT
jgi:dTDP-4-amino-4,6-dideoxygalactose transaminase